MRIHKTCLTLTIMATIVLLPCCMYLADISTRMYDQMLQINSSVDFHLSRITHESMNSNQEYNIDHVIPYGHVVSTADWYSHCSDSFRKTHYVAMMQRSRTGNRLFQLFTILALSRDYCYTAVLDPNITYLDEIFDINYVKREAVNKTSYKSIRDIDEVKGRKHLFSYTFYDQLDRHKNWTIYDFHQSYRYFRHHTDFIKSAVRFKPHTTKTVETYLKNITQNGRPVCTVHVRRGDAKKSEGLYINYLNKAFKFVRDRLKDVNFIFISDDMKYCRTKFQAPDIFYSPFKSPAEDLALMAYGEHIIMTHGTFGWMGAWLGNKGNQSIVLLPSNMDNGRWFFYMPEWTRIKM